MYPYIDEFAVIGFTKLTNSKASALISSMITSVVRLNVSILQVSLGLLVQEKRFIEHLYELESLLHMTRYADTKYQRLLL